MILATKAVDLDPGCTQGYLLLGTLLINAGHADKAINIMDRGIELASNPDELRIMKAFTLIKLNQPDWAVETVRPILDGPPSKSTPMAKMVEMFVTIMKMTNEKQE